MGSENMYEFPGECPICRQHVTFVSQYDAFRDHLICPTCPGTSIPRERAIAAMLNAKRPSWRSLAIHECSPVNRGISTVLSRECRDYTPTHFFRNEDPGKLVGSFRNENLEAQTFDDETFDIVLSQDVMEHVNRPELVVREVKRTLKPGGVYLFTTPTFKGKSETERRAEYLDNGEVQFFAEPDYHGNPIDAEGSLVTFHYGYDLPELIYNWCGLNVEVTRWWSPAQGIMGKFTEVYCCTKT